jgi:carbon-monoxide dehydrogenase medium subunit
LGPGKTILAPGEILVEIQIPVPQDHGHFCFFKLGRRNAFTLSIVSVATWVKVEKETFQGIRIALGAVAPTPMRVLKTEEYLLGQRVSEKTIDSGAKAITDEVQPISDVRASADYRKDMSYILTRRAILSCVTSNK